MSQIKPFESSEIGQNVFIAVPEHGTIVATVTAAEVDEINKIDDEMDAIRHASGESNYRPRYKELLQQRRDWWQKVLGRHGVPYVWPMSLDWTTGHIYINDKS